LHEAGSGQLTAAVPSELSCAVPRKLLRFRLPQNDGLLQLRDSTTWNSAALALAPDEAPATSASVRAGDSKTIMARTSRMPFIVRSSPSLPLRAEKTLARAG